MKKSRNHFTILFSLLTLPIFSSATLNKEIETKREQYGIKETLFDGGATDKWVWHHDKSECKWPVVNGALEVLPVEGHVKEGDGSIITKESYEDFYLHLEFKPNETPKDLREQGRGNSGVMLQDRYEIQVLDSYEHRLHGRNDCAAFYGLKDADINAAKPTDQWQSYDIFFTSARWDGQQKVTNARATVYWNGVLVHNDVELKMNTKFTTPEGPTPGPIRLQEHANPVQYRNIWIARKSLLENQPDPQK